MKKRITIFLFTILLLFISTNIVFAKYILEENMKAATIEIDRTRPEIKMEYSTKELTSNNVEVVIKANEEIKQIDGWVLEEDRKTLKKEYEENIEEEIIIEDISGNAVPTNIIIDNIDKLAPIINIIDIENSNSEYPNYANKDAKITFTISIIDDKKISKSIEEDDIKFFINEEEIIPEEKEFIIKEDTDIQKIILFTISKIEKEGNLFLKIPEGIIEDATRKTNLELEEDTKIKIDNTAPELEYLQEKVEDGRIKAIISSNEKVRNLEGWNLEDKTLDKVFTSNVSYKTEVEDLAGNSSKVEINVKNATNIILSYASHNSMIGWTYGYGNYDIAGLNAIRENPIYKTESLAFSILGDVEKDYLQARAYVYTYWGKNSKARCTNTNKIYTYGWNPENDTWKCENSETCINLNGTTYFQLGGSGANAFGLGDINGKNKIPADISSQFLYGISALQIKLKSYNQNSICYQVYVDKIGWLEPKSNGEITCYDETKPISALRVALIPNTEKESLLNTWKEDIYKTLTQL